MDKDPFSSLDFERSIGKPSPFYLSRGNFSLAFGGHWSGPSEPAAASRHLRIHAPLLEGSQVRGQPHHGYPLFHSACPLAACPLPPFRNLSYPHFVLVVGSWHGSLGPWAFVLAVCYATSGTNTLRTYSTPHTPVGAPIWPYANCAPSSMVEPIGGHCSHNNQQCRFAYAVSGFIYGTDAAPNCCRC